MSSQKHCHIVGCQASAGGISDLRVFRHARRVRVSIRSWIVPRNTQGWSTVDMGGLQRLRMTKSPTIQLSAQISEFVFARNSTWLNWLPNVGFIDGYHTILSIGLGKGISGHKHGPDSILGVLFLSIKHNLIGMWTGPKYEFEIPPKRSWMLSPPRGCMLTNFWVARFL